MAFIFGMPTLIEIPDIYNTVELCKELGLSFIELNMNMPEFCPENLKPEILRSIEERYKIKFTLHLPEETDLATFHGSVREGYYKRCIESFEWASSAGIRLINMHMNSGVYFTLPDRKVFIYEQYKDIFVGNLMKSFSRLGDFLQDKDMVLCMENCGDFYRGFIEEAVKDLLHEDIIKLTWDTGHEAKAKFVETHFLETNLEYIKHIHLNDSDENSDHKILFSGLANIDKALKLAEKKQLSVVIEVKTIEALRESVKRLSINKSKIRGGKK